MHHADYCFLLARAKLVEGYAARARAQGEEYHACVGFLPLSTGGRARLTIVDGKLRLAVKDTDGEAEARSIFGADFAVDGAEYVGAVPDRVLFTG